MSKKNNKYILFYNNMQYEIKKNIKIRFCLIKIIFTWKNEFDSEIKHKLIKIINYVSKKN